jgi:YHS domain-containing protein
MWTEDARNIFVYYFTKYPEINLNKFEKIPQNYLNMNRKEW